MNRRTHERIVLWIVAMLLLASTTGCVASASTSGSSDGATLVNEMCGRCHPVERVNGSTKDQAGWTATVGRMRSYGLTVSDEQAAAIIAHLAKRDAAK